MSRPVEAVHAEVLSHLPPGWIWPDGHDSLLAALLWPLAAGVAAAEQLAEDMMREVDPRTAIVCLEDFERVLGSDPCGRDVTALPTHRRQALAHTRWTGRGGQSVPYYIDLAAKRGVTITIRENTLSRAGVLRAGDELVNNPEQFAWQVLLSLGAWEVFRAGQNRAGDRLYTFDLSDIECDIRRAAPAHTDVYFSYVGI